MGKHKAYDAEFKTKVVLQSLRGQKSQAPLCREYGLAPDLLSHWREVFLERASGVFSTREQHSAEQERIAELERLVGQLTWELAASKKVSRLLPSGSRTSERS